MKHDIVKQYLDSNKDERKDLIEQLVYRKKVNKMGLEIEKLYEDVYKVGKIKVHCITMIDKLHLVSESQYNVRIYVENNNILSSIIESFDLEHFKVLVVFYDRKSFHNFIESFK